MARSIGIHVDGQRETIAALGRFQFAATTGVKAAVAKSTLSIHRRARRKLTEEKAVDTGRALSSIRFLILGLYGQVSVDAEHGKWIEFGTGPHFPPPAALAGWARRHGMAGMEFVIARKISEVGTPARPFLFPAYSEETPAFQAAVAAAIVGAARQSA
ncbi:MAG TPA: hypothetical protein VF156_15395 [Agromyces sp.]